MLQGKKSIMKILKNTDSHTEMRVITLTCDTEEREEIIYRWHAIMPAISRPRQSAKARHLDKNCRKISIFTKQVCQRRIVKQADTKTK
jgi:hypothetical protein